MQFRGSAQRKVYTIAIWNVAAGFGWLMTVSGMSTPQRKKGQQDLAVPVLLLQENARRRNYEILLVQLAENVAFHVKPKSQDLCAHDYRLNVASRVVVSMQQARHHQFSPILIVLTEDPYFG